MTIDGAVLEEPVAGPTVQVARHRSRPAGGRRSTQRACRETAELRFRQGRSGLLRNCHGEPIPADPDTDHDKGMVPRWRSTEGTRRRVAIVIGASSGIGRSTARALSGQGWNLVLASRSATALAAVERECAVNRGRDTRRRQPMSVTMAAVDALFERAVARFGRVDAVVNTAAAVATAGSRTSRPRSSTGSSPPICWVPRTSPGPRSGSSSAQGGGELVLTGSLAGQDRGAVHEPLRHQQVGGARVGPG